MGLAVYQASASCLFSLCRSKLFPTSFWQRIYLAKEAGAEKWGSEEAGRLPQSTSLWPRERGAPLPPQLCSEPFQRSFPATEPSSLFPLITSILWFLLRGRSWEGRSGRCFSSEGFWRQGPNKQALCGFLAGQMQGRGVGSKVSSPSTAALPAPKPRREGLRSTSTGTLPPARPGWLQP